MEFHWKNILSFCGLLLLLWLCARFLLPGGMPTLRTAKSTAPLSCW